jgi:beta-1,4-mannosyltransferase
MKIGLFPYGNQQNPYQQLLKEALESSGVQVVPMYKSRWKFLSFFQLLRVDVDVIHFFWPHDFYTGRGKIATVFKRVMFVLSSWVLSRRKLVYSVENLVSHEAHTALEIKDEQCWIQKIVKRSDAIVCMSHASLELFRTFYQMNTNTLTAVVPHVNYLSVYPNTITQEEARRKLNVSNEARVLLSLGRINRYKGLHGLIAAFKSVSTSDLDVLFIAGKCSDESLLSELKEISLSPGNGRVIIENRFIADEELQYYFNASNGVVLNYTDEPMNPGSVVMAMGYACCILAPEKEVLKELVPAGALFSYRELDQEDLSSAIQRFFHTRDLLQLGLLCKERVVLEHDPQKVGQILKSIYESIVT